MWQDLQYEWQVTFEEAWTAFCNGSTPIGGALFDDKGQLVIRDRNRAAENGTINRKISHGEANILRKLNTDERPDYKTMKLYTTMEPCPMCMGTIVMAGIRDVSYASRDTYCGAVHMLKVDAYMNSKNTKCTYVGGMLEMFQITMQSYYEMRYVDLGRSGKVLEDFKNSNPKAVAIAEVLYKDKLLDKWNGEKTAGKVFNAVCAMADEIKE